MVRAFLAEKFKQRHFRDPVYTLYGVAAGLPTANEMF